MIPGILESDPRNIAKNYARNWFMVDFVSCLPIQYVQLIVSDEGGGSDSIGKKTKSFKLIRLIRLTKLLRLAKVRRLVMQAS